MAKNKLAQLEPAASKNVQKLRLGAAAADYLLNTPKLEQASALELAGIMLAKSDRVDAAFNALKEVKPSISLDNGWAVLGKEGGVENVVNLKLSKVKRPKIGEGWIDLGAKEGEPNVVDFKRKGVISRLKDALSWIKTH